jgi:LmbE family N-acetylglucosaminyl deacetylase
LGNFDMDRPVPAAEPYRVSFIFAHPDDEAFTVGGTILKLKQEGAYVDLLCATRGEAGSTGNPPLCTREELPEVREQELKRACTLLQVNSVSLLDYKDKTLKEHVTDLEKDILLHLEKLQPHVVVTFHTNGLSGHPDHIAISQAVTQTIRRNHWPTRLYYVALPESEEVKRARSAHSVKDEDIDVMVSISPYKEAIKKALQAHRTQHQSVESVFPGVIAEDSSQSIPDAQHFIVEWDGSYEKTRTYSL